MLTAPGRAARQSSSAAFCCPRWRGRRHDPALGVGRQRARLGLLVAVDADQDLLAGLDAPQALAVGVDQRGLHVPHGLDRAAVLGDAGHLVLALSLSLDEALHDGGALEDVGYSSRSVS